MLITVPPPSGATASAAAPNLAVLSGVRVLELGGMGPVPFATMLLADHGAEVVALRRPPSADRPIPRTSAFDRGKQLVPADLQTAEGGALARTHAARVDVVVEGFRPGTAERLGVGPAELAEVNPTLVYARMTGWGQTGPLSRQAGHDLNYIGLAGFLNAVGRVGQPPTPPLNLVGDYGGGGLLLAFGIVSALLDVARRGEGRVIDCAMVDGVALLMAQYHAPQHRLGPRGTNIFDSGCPYYDVYETADGRYMAVAATTPGPFAALLDGLGLTADDVPGQRDRAGWPRLRERLAAAFRTRSRAEWERIFGRLDASVTPVLDAYEAPGHPQLAQRGTFRATSGGVEPAPAPRSSPLVSETGR